MRDEQVQTMSFEELEARAMTREQNAKLAEKKVRDQFALIARVALDALSKRIFLFASLAATVGLFAFSMAEPSVLRLISASAFAGLVFLPTLYKEKSNGD
jgi:hypothetical protein